MGATFFAVLETVLEPITTVLYTLRVQGSPAPLIHLRLNRRKEGQDGLVDVSPETVVVERWPTEFNSASPKTA